MWVFNIFIVFSDIASNEYFYNPLLFILTDFDCIQVSKYQFYIQRSVTFIKRFTTVQQPEILLYLDSSFILSETQIINKEKGRWGKYSKTATNDINSCLFHKI